MEAPKLNDGDQIAIVKDQDQSNTLVDDTTRPLSGKAREPDNHGTELTVQSSKTNKIVNYDEAADKNDVHDELLPKMK